MRWQARALVPVGILLFLALAQVLREGLGYAGGAAALLVRGATLVTLLIFRTGRMAFAVRAGLVYAGLAAVLLFWPGLFVIPHMVRLDSKRLLGVDPDNPGGDTLAS